MYGRLSCGHYPQLFSVFIQVYKEQLVKDFCVDK